MNRIDRLIFWGTCIGLLSSCSKKDDDYSDPSGIDLIEVISEETYEQAEFCSFVSKSFNDHVSLYVENPQTVSQLMSVSVSQIFSRAKTAVDRAVAQESKITVLQARNAWKVKKYNYSYVSTAYDGTPVRLSAAVCVPVPNDASVHHKLGAMSLCPPHMPADPNWAPTKDGTLLMARVAYNHAVVVPDYQGRGITAGMKNSMFLAHAHGVQSIDAATAAIALLKEKGYEFADGFGLYDVGVSEGGGTAYEIHEILEAEASPSVRNRLNLKQSFCANGITDYWDYPIDCLFNIYRAGVYDQPETYAYNLSIHTDAFVCMPDILKNGYTAEDFCKEEFFGKDAVLDRNMPLFKTYQDAIAVSHFSSNWNPQHILALAGSFDDATLPFKANSYKTYQLIRNHPDGTENENVRLLEYDLPVSSVISAAIGKEYMFDHIMADMFCFLHAIRYENPAEHEINVTF